jgi:hypothetical protein
LCCIKIQHHVILIKLLRYHYLLEQIGKLGCKPASTPIDSKYKLNTKEDEPLEDINYF